MKKKKVIALFLCAALLFSVCAGCGEKEVDSAKGEEKGEESEAPPVRLELSGMKTEFAYGEAFSTEGLTVTARLSNGSAQALAPSEYKVISAGYDAQKEGNYEIVVRMNALAATYNVTVGRRPSDWRDDGVLKILMIGNSFSDDASWHMPLMAESADVDFYFGNVYYSGCSIDWHYDWLQRDVPNYDYRTYGKGDVSWNTHGKYLLRDAITETNWDYVTLQFGTAGGNVVTDPRCYDLLDDLYLAVRELVNEDAQIVWHMTWADQCDSPRDQFVNANGGDQMRMYEGIVETVKTKVLAVEGLEKVIPTGTAIQNARTSYLGDTLTRDGYHLSALLGRYLAGLTVFCSLTGIEPDEVGYPDFLDEKECQVVWESAVNALQDPYEVTQSKIK